MKVRVNSVEVDKVLLEKILWGHIKTQEIRNIPKWMFVLIEKLHFEKQGVRLTWK